MQSEDTHVLFARILLRLHQAGGPLDTHNQTPSDLGVKGPTVTRLLDPQDSLHPGDDLVRRRVGGFVQVQKATPASRTKWLGFFLIFKNRLFMQQCSKTNLEHIIILYFYLTSLYSREHIVC